MSRVIQVVRRMFSFIRRVFSFKSPYPDIDRMNHEELDRYLWHPHEVMGPHKHAYAVRRLKKLAR